MGELIAKIERLLDARFPGQNNKLDLAETVPNEKIGGSFITERFRGMPQIDRQTAIRRMLREQLTREEMLSVGVIFTLTPQEVAAMDEVMATA